MSQQPPAVPVVRIRRWLPAPPEEVFAAWTDGNSLKQWLCPGKATVAAVELDVRVGGRFRIVMRDQGREYEHTGEYREVRPPACLIFTWCSPATGGAESLVTLEFRPQADGTEMRLTHERLLDARAAEKHQGGWASIVAKLEAHLGPGGNR